MNVIRHDNVPAHGDPALAPSALDKDKKRLVDVWLREPWSALLRAKGDEVNRYMTMGVKHSR